MLHVWTLKSFLPGSGQIAQVFLPKQPSGRGLGSEAHISYTYRGKELARAACGNFQKPPHLAKSNQEEPILFRKPGMQFSSKLHTKRCGSPRVAGFCSQLLALLVSGRCCCSWNTRTHTRTSVLFCFLIIFKLKLTSVSAFRKVTPLQPFL